MVDRGKSMIGLLLAFLMLHIMCQGVKPVLAKMAGVVAKVPEVMVLEEEEPGV